MGDAITGRVIGQKYRITGLLRSGRMGDIYVGRSLDTNERVQVKMLDPTLFGETEAIKRFERETKITQKIDHPCTLVVRDSGRTEDGLPWMCTEYVDGVDLSEAIEEAECLPPERAGYIAAQIAMALDAAHQAGVVHRDLSPSNILLTDAGGHADSVKVLDFGLSRLAEGGDPDESTLTAVGVRIGTPYYMAPEYIEEYALDHRADLYSLGIVLFEMLTGHPPFTGRPYKVMDKHLNEPPPAPSSENQAVPPWLDALVGELLVKDPSQRIQTAREAVERLEAGLDERLQRVSAPEPATPVEAMAQQRTHTPNHAGQQDPTLKAMIDSILLDVKRGTGKVNPQDALLVARVAPGSPAAEMGVQAGWLCLLPSERVTGLRDPRLYRSLVQERQYVLADPTGSTRLEVRATGASLGMELIRTAEHIRAFYAPSKGSKEALMELWRQGDWALLEKLSWKTLTHQRGAAGMLNTGLFAKFLGGGKQSTESIKRRDDPALLFYGASLIETGRAHEGVPLIEEYLNEHSSKHPAMYEAVATYYVALEQERGRRSDAAVDTMLQSWLLWNSERAADGVERMSGRRPMGHAWYGRRFPDYTLDVIGQRGQTAGLYRILDRIEQHEVVAVVAVGDTRTSEALDEFLHQYHNYGYFFRDLIATVHLVVTDTASPGDPQWNAGEDKVRQAEHPLEVLEDYKAFVHRALKPMTTPTVYIVSKRGYVMHEGLLNDVDLWGAFDAVGRLRRGEFR